jgi:UDP-glucose 4-epimerase
MQAVVTGGAGFIGSNLVQHLIQQGHQVTVLDNLSSGYRVNVEAVPEACFIEGDVRDPAAVAKSMKGAEVVFHIAASVGNKRSLDNPVQDAEINVLGTLQVLIAARRAGARKIVFSSSAAIFGELTTLPIREDHPCEPDTPYGASKLGAEKECLAFAKNFGIEVIALRYFNVYGPNQRYDAYGNVIPIFAFQILRGEPIVIFGDGEQTRDFVNVGDVVQANMKAATAPGVSGSFNIGSGQRLSIHELVRLLKRTGNLDFKVNYGPPRQGDVRHSLADISAAQSAFGFCPQVPLDKGLTEYWNWAREEIHRSGSNG